MKAFHDKQSTKDFYVERMKAHMAADELVRGVYWEEEEHRGCAVGCTLQQSENVHAQFEPVLGIPRQLALLEDGLFENTPTDYYKTFLEAIPVGADLSLVTPRFLVWLLTDEQDGVVRFADARGKEVTRLVASLYQRIIDGGEVADSARDAAWDAATKRQAEKLLELLRLSL